MKVLDVSEFYSSPGGGVRTYTNHKLKAARALGHELVVVAPGPENREELSHGGRVVWLKSPPMPGDPRYHVFVNAKAVHDAIARERPDLVEGSSVWSGGFFAGSAKVSCPKVLVFHQDPVAVYSHTFLDRYLSTDRIDSMFSPYWRMLRHLSSRFDLTVTAASWLARRLRERGIDNAHAVPFGSDLSTFADVHVDEALRRELLVRTGTPEHGKLLVCVSRHHPEKRLATLCHAVAQVRREMPVGLVIFGDGPIRSWVERTARKTGGVHVYGFCSDRKLLASALASADGLLHGSAAETYGIAIAEALRTGLPVIVPSRGGAADLVDASCSEVYTAGDVDECADAIKRLLSRDSAKLKRAALRHAKGLRSLDDHFAELFGLYSGLACSVRPGTMAEVINQPPN